MTLDRFVTEFGEPPSDEEVLELLDLLTKPQPRTFSAEVGASIHAGATVAVGRDGRLVEAWRGAKWLFAAARAYAKGETITFRESVTGVFEPVAAPYLESEID